MSIGDPGAPWTLEDVQAVGRAEWVQVGGLTRGDFPPDVLAALARDRRLALDGQALVRPATAGPLVLDADFDPAVLAHVTALKLNEEEVEALGGEEAVTALGVPELLLTHGSTGALLISRGVRERIPVRRIDTATRPGAGDAFLAAYVWARASGHRPVSAARHAATTAARGARADRTRRGRVSALVRTVEGVFRVDVETELVLGEVDVRRPRAARARAAAGRRRLGRRRDRRRRRRPPAAARRLLRRRRDLERGGRRAAARLRRRRRPGRPRPDPLRRPQPALPLDRRRPLLALARARAAGRRSRRLGATRLAPMSPTGCRGSCSTRRELPSRSPR